jgi:hypothetical protein
MASSPIFTAVMLAVLFVALVIIILALVGTNRRPRLPEPAASEPVQRAQLTAQPWGDNWQMTVRDKKHPLKIAYNERAIQAHEERIGQAVDAWWGERVENY